MLDPPRAFYKFHSANLSESRNYAVALSFLDILFGTFYYRPGSLPERIGVVDPGAYPKSNEFWKVMMLPFEARDASINIPLLAEEGWTRH